MAKPEALVKVLERFNPRSAIVFCNTKSDTELVEAVLTRRGYNAKKINSDLTQKERNRIMDEIRADELRFLIATDVAARGIDIDHIDLVVNYALHDLPETYVHRTGRTGRAGRAGLAVSLVAPQDFGAITNLRKARVVELRPIDLDSAPGL
jgi:ATP-dependent RNA helicase DeaD